MRFRSVFFSIMEPKIHHPYIKVGRIKSTVAQDAHIKCADIYISKNQIKHISARHHIELQQLGMTVEQYIGYIIDNYNQIRKGAGESILLVVYDDGNSKHDSAAMALNYSIEKEFWEIKTAQPRKTDDILKREKIW